MAPIMLHEADAVEEDMEAGTESSPHTAPAVSTHGAPVPSPVSTESLIERTLDKLLLTPLGDMGRSPSLSAGQALTSAVTPIDLSSFLATFSKMLARGLAQIATQITSTIQADLQNLGTGIETIEQKAEHMIARANQNTARIQDLQDQLDSALGKIDDL